MRHPFSEILIDTARGARPADAILHGGRVVDVYTGEVYPADVAIADGRIAMVGAVDHLDGPQTQVHDVAGLYLMPGFIDGHQHLEDSRLSVSRFSDTVVPAGTTSIVSGLDHIAAVAGVAGVRAFLDEADQCDLTLFWAAPFRLPYTIPPATIPTPWTQTEHSVVQAWPECIGVWELSPGFLENKDPTTLAALRTAHDRRGGIYGCVPWVKDDHTALAVHVAAGLVVDHEAYSCEELLVKMRSGLRVMIRDSPVEHFLPVLIGLFRDRPELAHLVGFCTDQLSVRDVLANGHINRLVREAVASGIPPVTAVQMATINTAVTYRIDDILGSITPGRRGDILVADDLADFTFSHVFVGGRLVARDGEMIQPSRPTERPSFLCGPFARPPLVPEDFDLTATGTTSEALVLNLTDNAFHRTASHRAVPVVAGKLEPDPESDIARVAYVERTGTAAIPAGVGLVTGFGLTDGALATSCSPDDENILCVGRNTADMALAVNTLLAAGGGEIVVADGRVVHMLPLPIGGIVCDLAPRILAEEQHKLVAAASKLGCKLVNPFMFLGILGITGIPDYGLSEHGVVEYQQHAVVPVVRAAQNEATRAGASE